MKGNWWKIFSVAPLWTQDHRIGQGSPALVVDGPCIACFTDVFLLQRTRFKWSAHRRALQKKPDNNPDQSCNPCDRANEHWWNCFRVINISYCLAVCFISHSKQRIECGCFGMQPEMTFFIYWLVLRNVLLFLNPFCHRHTLFCCRMQQVHTSNLMLAV